MKIPNTLDQLREQILEANWFTQLGQFTSYANYRAITTLEPPPDTVDDWDWLPTTVHQYDPVHSPALKEIAHSQSKDKELASATSEFYRLALVSLRRADEANILFHVGVSDLFPAAKGAALFAVRMAVSEIVTGHQGLWCHIVSLYSAGFYPCGYNQNDVIVF